MRTVMNSIDSPAHYAYVEKKSEFIGDTCHIDSLDDVKDFVESIRLQHPKARHVCYAAIVGDSPAQLHERMSDDGEPSGTAGKPILHVLRQSRIINTIVTVTRYFGGILLGAGGLVRAYSTATSEVIGCADTRDVISARRYSCDVQYAQYALLERIIIDCAGRITHQDFTDKVRVEFLVPDSYVTQLMSVTQHVFQATVNIVSRGAGTLVQGQGR